MTFFETWLQSHIDKLYPHVNPWKVKKSMEGLVERLLVAVRPEHRPALFRYVVVYAFRQKYPKDVVATVCEKATPLVAEYFRESGVDLFAATIRPEEANPKLFPIFIRKGKWDMAKFDSAMKECGIRDPAFGELDYEDVLGLGSSASAKVSAQ